MDCVTYTIDNGIARVTLNRPKVRNAFDGDVIKRLTDIFSGLDSEVHAVVLTGEGTAFCAGADLKWMAQVGSAGDVANARAADDMAAMFTAIDEAPVAVLARVNGPALGGGLGLIACCDIVVAPDTVRFSFSEVRLGLVPAVISPFVLNKIGVAQARRYFVSGELFDAHQAAAMGLVHEVADPVSLDERVEAILASLRRNGPRAMGEAKELIRRVSAHGGAMNSELHAFTAQTIARLRASEEGQEGMQAFAQKRAPAWAPAK